uniref:Uncharacterized protein n=1 Tax=Meloidogyne enterolobii TaxID=390850 RepID=A0A6V7X4Q1_MELEN|nr:unnamed protein product [Meloidogyne enterolobii]
MTSVSPKLLAKLPLPPGFEALPSNIKEKIKEINGDPSIDWSKKHLKVKELIGALPQQQHPHPLLHNPSIRIPSTQIQQTNSGNVIPEFFPPNPPPGFEKVLPPEVYQQLLQIHRNPQLTVQQKSLQIDQIMRSLPQNIIDNLPLPPGFDKLPPKYIKEVRKIFGDKSLNFQEKDQKIVEFVHSLPLELRKLTRPPLPPAFEKLNFETKEKISNLFDDITLDDKQRQNNFWKIVNQLPEDEKAKVNEAFKFPF